MLTGTPLDLTPFGPLLSLLGLGYWLLAFGLAALAAWYPRSLPVKLALGALVLAAFTFPVLRHVGTKARQLDESQSRLADAMALFAERCKTAGERIFRTVDNVEGVVWMKWREETSNADNYADQWKLNDPYGNDCGGEDCIAALLRVSEGQDRNPEGAKRYSAGYRYVEAVDPRDSLRYRYRAALKLDLESVQREKESGAPPAAYQFRFKMDRDPIEAFNVRYGITWDDISTRDDRERWIAGGSLKVIDLQTGEVLGERIGYMVDRGQGSQAGFRSPWGLAVQTACPPFLPVGPTDPRHIRRSTETRDFALKILRPSPRD